MLSREAFGRSSCAAAAVGLALAGLSSAANATLPGYFATNVMLPLPPFPAAPIGLQIDVRPQPVVLAAAETAPGGAANAPTAGAPSGATAGAPGAAMNVNPPMTADPDSPFADLGGILGQAAEPGAPAWLFATHIGLAEIATDNVEHTATDHKSDLISELSAGVIVTGSTPRLQTVVNYTATIRRALSNNRQNRISHVGAATGHLTIVPDYVFLNLAGAAHDIVRDGFGATNPALLTNNEATQIFTFSAAPSFQTRVGTIGFLKAQYSFSELWRQGNTGTLTTGGGTIGPFSGGTSQQARVQFQMPGTFDARMMNEVALRASESVAGKIGTIRKAGGDLITEYQLTRSVSAIGSGGYESLSAPNVPAANGQGPTWEVGGRWRPTVDSSFLLLYGSHDLKTDVSGQIIWRLTPLTTFTASYTDSLTTSQQNLLGNNGAAQLDAGGSSLGVTYEDDPVIAILGDTSLTGDTSTQPGNFGGGFPSLEADNLIPNQNGIARIKALRSRLFSTIFGESVSVTAFRVERISLIGGTNPDTTHYGTNLIWVPTITEDVTGRAEIGFRTSEPGNQHTYNLALGLTYDISPTFHAGLRYDYLRQDSTQQSFAVNAITLRLRKLF